MFRREDTAGNGWRYDLKPMKLTLLTPIGSWSYDDGDLVVVTTKDGARGFMRHHLPTIVEIIPGPVRYRVPSSGSGGETWRAMVVSVGYAEVQADEVTVVVNAAELPETIDRERAERALERAEAIVRDPLTEDLERTRARHAMRRAKARIDFHRRFVEKEKR